MVEEQVATLVAIIVFEMGKDFTFPVLKEVHVAGEDEEVRAARVRAQGEEIASFLKPRIVEQECLDQGIE
jgi:hypothetical protein